MELSRQNKKGGDGRVYTFGEETRWVVNPHFYWYKIGFSVDLSYGLNPKKGLSFWGLARLLFYKLVFSSSRILFQEKLSRVYLLAYVWRRRRSFSLRRCTDSLGVCISKPMAGKWRMDSSPPCQIMRTRDCPLSIWWLTTPPLFQKMFPCSPFKLFYLILKHIAKTSWVTFPRPRFVFRTSFNTHRQLANDFIS